MSMIYCIQEVKTVQEPIYFSKIEFKEFIGHNRLNIIFLNLGEKELAYQVFAINPQAPSIQGTAFKEYDGIKFSVDLSFPARMISSEKTDFKPKLFKTEHYVQKELFSYGIKLTDEQIENLLPYCNALDFEPFRNRKMTMSDNGYIGYRDEVNTKFKAITNSYIPLIKLPMDYYYDEQHIWPSEKLYSYLTKTYFENNPETKKWSFPYGSFSLFID